MGTLSDICQCSCGSNPFRRPEPYAWPGHSGDRHQLRYHMHFNIGESKTRTYQSLTLHIANKIIAPRSQGTVQ